MDPRWGPQPTLTDGTIRLRPFNPGDAWAMRAWDEDPETQRFFGYPALPPTNEHIRRAWWVIERWRREYARGERIPFLVEDAEGHRLGSVELRDVRGAEAEISYMTVPGRRREGIATAAVRLLCERAPDHFGIKRIYLKADPANEPSMAVARNCGFIEVERSHESVRYLRS
jgi:RimJ/RimL family protein N-acetyltransferase